MEITIGVIVGLDGEALSVKEVRNISGHTHCTSSILFFFHSIHPRCLFCRWSLWPQPMPKQRILLYDWHLGVSMHLFLPLEGKELWPKQVDLASRGGHNWGCFHYVWLPSRLYNLECCQHTRVESEHNENVAQKWGPEISTKNFATLHGWQQQVWVVQPCMCGTCKQISSEGSKFVVWHVRHRQSQNDNVWIVFKVYWDQLKEVYGCGNCQLQISLRQRGIRCAQDWKQQEPRQIFHLCILLFRNGRVHVWPVGFSKTNNNDAITGA